MARSGSINTSGYNGRYLVFSWEVKSQSISSNTTTIEWVLYGAGESTVGFYQARNFKVTIDDAVVFSQTDRSTPLYNGTVVASGTHTFKHDSNGTKAFRVEVEAGIYTSAVNCRGSGSFALDSIPRASKLTAALGTLGTEQTLTITPGSATFKHRLTYKCGDVSGYIAGSATDYTTATSIKWTPPIGLAHENPTGSAVTITLTLYTYTSDGDYVGANVHITSCLIPSSVKPSCSITWEDVSGAYNRYGVCVQGISRLKITLAEQTAYSSPIEYRSISANGSKYNETEATTGVLMTTGSNVIKGTVQDQRGRTGSASTTLTVQAYSNPMITAMSVHRCDADGTENDQGEYIKATFSAKVTALPGGGNSAAYKLYYRPSTSAEATEVRLTQLANQLTVSNFSYIFKADSASSYVVTATVTDNHSSGSHTTNASTAFTLINWKASGTGIAFGKVSENENTFEVGLASEFYDDVCGRVMGLGALPAIPEYADLNDYTAPGCYAIASNAIASTISNMPIPYAGRLFVSASSGGSVSDDGLWQYREQRFVPYRYGSAVAIEYPALVRFFARNGTPEWTFDRWINEALKAYPIGSIHMRYDDKNPGDLFGGTWTQITARVLRAGSVGQIGTEGSIADGSGRTYIDIAVWRRTA